MYIYTHIYIYIYIYIFFIYIYIYICVCVYVGVPVINMIMQYLWCKWFTSANCEHIMQANMVTALKELLTYKKSYHLLQRLVTSM